MRGDYGLNIESVNGVKRKINELLHHKEVFWRQSVGPFDFRRGIKKQYFSTKGLSQWRRKNNIDGLHDSGGTWHTDLDRVAMISEDYSS